jgi:hypothetical protein
MLALLGVLAAAVAAVLLLGVVVAVIGAALVIAIKMIPVLILGFIAVKLLRRGEGRRRGLSSADQAWLDCRA